MAFKNFHVIVAMIYFHSFYEELRFVIVEAPQLIYTQ